MSSRLERLFVLLESGGSGATRRAAARQLGEVQRLHPHEMHRLLARTARLLRAAAWDTRVAAAAAVEAVLRQAPPWPPPAPLPATNTHADHKSVTSNLSLVGRMTFQKFDINKVLSNGSHLMGSEGKEYDLEEDISGLDIREKMARQRQLLNAKLGLDVASKIGMDMSELFSNEDLQQPLPSPENESTRSDEPVKRSAGEAVQQEMASALGLSSREANRARRKARQAVLKQRSRDTDASVKGGDSDASAVSEEPECKRLRTTVSLEEDPNTFVSMSLTEHGAVPDGAGGWSTETVDWPFEAFCDQLCQDLFSPCWEARHGAATALREVIKIHGKGAGQVADASEDENRELHQAWLEDMALRLLCVLALDRFGDFVSDQVVAPVRETCAQALGSVVHLMEPQGVGGVLSVLLQLLQRSEWEARHGGLLGIKYLLAVRSDLVAELLNVCLPAMLEGLSDEVDDVGAVAAAALTPLAPVLATQAPELLRPTVQRLWQLLQEQDELAAACNSFMGLLAALLSLPEAQPHLRSQPLCEVVPRLWPFLSHATSSVRRATLQTLYTLTLGSLGTSEGNGEIDSHGGHVNNQWASPLLQDALRHIFQRALVEPNPDIQELAEKVWGNLVRHSSLQDLLLAACPYMSTWLCLTMQPTRLAIDPALLIQCKTNFRERSMDKIGRGKFRVLLSESGGAVTVSAPGLPALSSPNTQPPKCELKYFVGGNETTPVAQREKNVVRARCMASRMLGLLSCYIVLPAPGIEYTADMESPTDCYVKVLLVYLNSKSALQRLVAGLVVAEWARIEGTNLQAPPPLVQRLHQCLGECVYFDEIALSFTRLLQDTKDFLAMLKHYKLPLDSQQPGTVLTLDQIQQLSGPVAQTLLSSHKLKPKVHDGLEERRRAIQQLAAQTCADQLLLNVSTQAALAGAVAMLRSLPEKLNPVVKPLMESIKREETEPLQALSASHLAYLVNLCVERNPCPNAKIITNLCTFLRSDTEFSPKIQSSGPGAGMDGVNAGSGTAGDSGVESANASAESSRTNTPTSFSDNYAGILTLANQQMSAERAALRRSNSTGGRGPGRPPITDIPLEELFGTEDSNQKQNRIQRRGASYALTAITSFFGKDLPSKLPKLWESMLGHLMATVVPKEFEPALLLNNDSAAEELVCNLLVLEVTCPALHAELLPQVLESLPCLCTLLSHPYRAVRHMSARCLGTLAALAPGRVMTAVVQQVLPLLGATHAEAQRQGAIEVVACIVEKLQLNIVPYIVLLIVPLLGRMSDQNQPVRLLATHCFATLIQLMPLDGGLPEAPELPQELLAQRGKERAFLEQLFNPKCIGNYVVPVPVKAELRSYQQAGVNWLSFLNQYKLHGILCDDMGLGKTLQSICILAGDHYYRNHQYKITKSPDCAPLPSLVVCPPTLTGHWVYEVHKFIPKQYLNPLQYVGPPLEREMLRSRVKNHNLIIASYDIVRKDIEFFSSIKWNYCILDEGHIIKNGKTKSSKAIKQLVANHRLILSGTPIQNNVLELWSLFDFLMPGFLGTERQFTAKYSRPILASRDPKSSPREQEAGALAMEALHRQVLPFLLRRMKEDVLKDLPPKITQDYYCELSPLQEQLYEDFSRSQAHQSLQETLVQASNVQHHQGSKGNTHIFQALRYLQNVCNHPKLVLSRDHPEFDRIQHQLKQQNSSLGDINHAAKLPALKQLLLDCGIGVDRPSASGSGSAACNAAGAPEALSVVGQHRALVFCQLKAMLDILENDLFKSYMPGVSYLRLDGSIPSGMRHSVVTRFNNDPSIDVLLLTTQVGGLGLNLTGADTVIFVEHDWNPMKDLQAMDRAHRIGQKKVVNVYRLITRGTLEEKIMGLQKFKLHTANTVISSENASMETMGTDQLLDLFALDSRKREPETPSGALKVSDHTVHGGGSVKAMLESLPELWEEKQYEEEYDLSAFVRSLHK